MYTLDLGAKARFRELQFMEANEIFRRVSVVFDSQLVQLYVNYLGLCRA